MDQYCKYCGKALPEGTPCDCAEAQSERMSAAPQEPPQPAVPPTPYEAPQADTAAYIPPVPPADPYGAPASEPVQADLGVPTDFGAAPDLGIAGDLGADTGTVPDTAPATDIPSFDSTLSSLGADTDPAAAADSYQGEPQTGYDPAGAAYGQQPYDPAQAQQPYDPGQAQYGQQPAYDPNQPQYGQPGYDAGQAQYGQQPYDPNQPQYGQQPYDPNQPQYGQQPYDPNQPQYGQQPYDPNQPQYGQQPYAPGQPQQYGQQPYAPGYDPYGQTQKSSSKKVLVIALVAVVVLIGVAVTAFVLLWNGDSEPAISPAVDGNGRAETSESAPLVVDGAIEFREYTVERAVRDYLRKASGDITQDDLKGITTLSFVSTVSSVNGFAYEGWYNYEHGDIQYLDDFLYFPDLLELEVAWQRVSDISLVAEMPNLTYLGLDCNSISDLSPVAGLTKLTYLGLWDNRVVDVTPLQNLVNLEELDLDENLVEDVSALLNLTSMQTLYLRDNYLGNVDGLRNMTAMKRLDLSENFITDISGLTNMGKCTSLDLDSNNITDIRVLSELTSLESLYISYNRISDLSPLANLSRLSTLFCYDNPVEDWSPVDHIYSVYGRDSYSYGGGSYGTMNIDDFILEFFTMSYSDIEDYLGDLVPVSVANSDYYFYEFEFLTDFAMGFSSNSASSSNYVEALYCTMEYIYDFERYYVTMDELREAYTLTESGSGSSYTVSFTYGGATFYPQASSEDDTYITDMLVIA